MWKRIVTGVAVCLTTGVLAAPGWAVTFDFELYYTLFSGEERVKRLDFTYDDGGGGISGVTKTLIATATQMAGAPGSGGTAGADGIVGNPNDPDSLLVGGQNTGRIFNVNKAGGVDSATPAGVSTAFHLEVPDATKMYVTGIPGALGEVPLMPDGSVGAGSSITLLGDDTAITQVITTPSGSFYTSSGPGGNGAFGSIVFGAGTATTTRIATPVPAAHGATYDPFSGDILLFGDEFISQYDLGGGGFIGDLDVSALGATQLDQGTVDGKGHIIVADNGGDLIFVDYKSTALVTTNDFSAGFFLDDFLDDVAPLVGSGRTDGGNNEIPEPLTGVLGIMGLSLLSLRMRRQSV